MKKLAVVTVLVLSALAVWALPASSHGGATMSVNPRTPRINVDNHSQIQYGFSADITTDHTITGSATLQRRSCGTCSWVTVTSDSKTSPNEVSSLGAWFEAQFVCSWDYRTSFVSAVGNPGGHSDTGGPSSIFRSTC